MSTDIEMKKYTLKPTCGKAVRFTGVQIATANGHWQAGREQTRWTELTLYLTKSGKYVLFIEYITQWQGEQCNDRVEICDSPAAVVEALRDQDGELGRLDTELLREAAENDRAFEAVTVDDLD